MNNHNITCLAIMFLLAIPSLGGISQMSFAQSNENDVGQEDLAEKYKDIEWFDDCPGTEISENDNFQVIDQRIAELPSLINATSDKDEKQDLQEEYKCLSHERTEYDKRTSGIFDGFSDAYKMVDLYDQRQDIDRQLLELMNN